MFCVRLKWWGETEVYVVRLLEITAKIQSSQCKNALLKIKYIIILYIIKKKIARAILKIERRFKIFV